MAKSKVYTNKILKDDGYILLVEDNQGKTFKISKKDSWILDEWYWSINTQGYVHRGTYHAATKKYTQIILSRFLMGDPVGFIVEHIDEDITNNDRLNLKITTQEFLNYKKYSTVCKKSKYRGVCWDKNIKKWKAQICVKGLNYNLGHYISEDDAGLAYNEAIYKLRNGRGKINIISGNKN